MSRISIESNIEATASVPEMTKEILRLRVFLDEKGVEPTGRKLEIHKEAYFKLRESLNALDVFLGCEIIISTQYKFAKMWGWTK